MKNLPSTLFKFIGHFIKPHKFKIISLFTFAALAGLYGNINSYLMKLIIDTIANHSNSNSLINAIKLPAILFVVNFEVHSLLWRGVDYVNIKLVPEIKNSISSEMFSYVLNHSYRFFQDNHSGSISSNIRSIAENIETIIHDALPHITRGSVQLVLALISMYFINPIFCLALLLWTCAFCYFSLRYSNSLKILAEDYAQSEAMLSGKLNDSTSCTVNVKLFAREDFEIEYIKDYLANTAVNYRNKQWFLLKFWWLQGSSISILIAVMLFTLIILKSHNLVDIGDFAFIIGLTLYVSDNIWGLTEQIDKINDSIGQANQSIKMIIRTHDIIDRSDALDLQVSSADISFDKVSFSYNSSQKLFDKMSVFIPAGQKVGIVGISGSGKTTFTNLITRMFDIDSGIIQIDGQDISAVKQCDLRNNISFIPQDPILFHRSFMENIRYGRIDASDEEVVKAAIDAHAHEFISQSEDGYKTLVGDRGVKLSGGQRQRIAIARAILKNAPILIMDEATSALDSMTESYIQKGLSNVVKDKTAIIIAHRLSTLTHLDRILVFDKGMIKEDGTHQELIARRGIYSLLYNSQINGFLPENI